MAKQMAKACSTCVRKHARRILKLMKLAAAPMVMMQLVFLTVRQPMLVQESSYDFVEFCAGAHEATKAAWRRQKMAVLYEIAHGPETMDILSGTGYATALHLATRLKRLATSVLAPVCSSWVPINIGGAAVGPS